MDLSGILAISSYPGLFKMIGQTKGGIVVESLVDGKRMPAYTSQRILSLEDITIYTVDGDVPLIEVFDKIAKKEKHGKSLDPSKVKIDELRDYLQGVQKDYDRERVYASDLKKLFVWYNLLSEKGLTKDAKEEKEANVAKAEKKAKSDKKESKPKKAKKPAAKKAE
jgi:hypothetical protein